MKIYGFMAFLAVLTGALLAYLLYYIALPDKNAVTCGAVSWVCLSATLGAAIAIHVESSRLSINMRVLSTTFFVVFLILEAAFALFDVKMPYYIIINGILFILFLGIYYKMSQIKDV